MFITQDQTIYDTLSFALVIALVLACMSTDVLKRRIPNCLTFPAVAAGLALAYLGNGWNGFLWSGLGLLIGFGLLFVLYLIGGMGAGDVKLMAAIGALLGFPAIIQVLVFTMVFGGLVALITALRRQVTMEALSNACSILIHPRLGEKMAGAAQARATKSAGTIPYGVAIGLGTLAYLFIGAIV